MRKHIERLRQKPEAHRKFYAFVGAAGLTAVIAAAWMMSFSWGGSPSVAQVSSASIVTPVEEVKRNASGMYSNVKDQWQDIKKTFEVLKSE